MAKKENLSLDELLEQSLVKDEDNPYDVPSNWIWSRLGAVCIINPPKINIKLQPDELEVSFIPMSAVSEVSGRVVSSETRTLNKVKNGYTNFIEKDILFAKITPCMENGKVAIVKHLHNGIGFGSTEFYVIRTSKCITTEFIYFLVRAQWFRQEAKEHMTGSVGQQRVPKQFLENYYIAIPPLPEQQRIVNLLESIFEKLDRAKKIVQNILDSSKNRKSTILHKAITGELTSKWREDNGTHEWKRCTLNDIILEKPRNGYSPNGVSYQTKYKNLTLSATTTGTFKGECFKYVDIELDENSHLWLKNGDILIQRSNSLDYVGVSAIYDGKDNEYIYPDLMMKIKPNDDFVNSKYLYYILSDIDVKRYFRNNATGTAGNMPKINQKTVMNTPVFLPPLTEQNEIVRVLDNLLENEQKAKELCNVIENIDLLKKSILARAFRGELNTNVPNEESALELLKEVLKERLG